MSPLADSLTLGAYPSAAPMTAAEEDAWYHQLAGIDAAGALEIPYSNALHPAGAHRLGTLLPEDWNVVVTMLPLTFQTLTRDPAYGLASTDSDGRLRAVQDVVAAHDAIRELTAVLGRDAVTAVQLHSAPRIAEGHAASPDALFASISELARLDWGSTALVIEHCDARHTPSPEKGFLTIEEETDVASAAQGLGADIGQSVNWGRSAIEGRSVEAPVLHLAELSRRGTLRGVMFSGASATGSTLGAAWRDVHNPIAPHDPASLLDSEQIARSLAAIDPAAHDGIRFVGAKVKTLHTGPEPDARTEALRHTVAAVAAALRG